MMRYRLTLIALVVLGCGGEDVPSQPQEPMDFFVANHTLSPVTLRAGGKSLGNLPAGVTTMVLTTARSVEWTRGPVTLADGRTIVDDMTSGSVQAPDIATGLVAITNVASGEVYFAPRVINSSGMLATVGIVTNGSLRCIATMPSPGSSGFLGYYRLTTSTELRFYGGSACSGGFSTMPHGDLQMYEPGSGALLIELTAP